MSHTPLLPTALIFIALATSPLNAEETGSANEPETAREAAAGAYPEEAEPLEVRLGEVIAPLSRALMHLLATTLPAENGRNLPLGLSIAPNGPNDDGPMVLVFTCLFGPVLCEPFFEACDALGMECSDGGL